MKATREQMDGVRDQFTHTLMLSWTPLSRAGLWSIARLLNETALRLLDSSDQDDVATNDLMAARLDLAREYERTSIRRPKRRWKIANLLLAVDSLLSVIKGDWKPDVDGSCFDLYCAEEGFRCARGRNRRKWADGCFYASADRVAEEALS